MGLRQQAFEPLDVGQCGLFCRALNWLLRNGRHLGLIER
jgi:hypothetical protein